MAEIIQMLALSPTMEKGIIQKWLVKEGDTIVSGDILCEVETDKSAMEYESINDGTLLKILTHEGEEATVGMPIAIAGEEGEDITELLKEASLGIPPALSSPVSQEQAVTPPEKGPGEAPQPNQDIHSGKIKASPLARVLAKEQGINLGAIKGSGPGGRIIKRDIEQQKTPARANSEPAIPVQTEENDIVIPISEKRRVIAQRLSYSKYTAPHYYLKTTVVVDNLLAARKQYNAKHTDTPLSFNAFLMKLVAEAIKKNPVINTSWSDEAIIQHAAINIALAVAQEDGLITPVVTSCDKKGIREIDNELKILIQKARNGQLLPEEYTGSTFTISNMGSYDMDEFTAIINPPEAAILAVGRANKIPVVNESNEIAIQTVIKMTLSCDHRLIDGAKGAQFLKDLKDEIEYPVLTLL